MGEIYFNLFLFVVSIAGLINTLSWQVIKDTSGGPATYPRIILTALLACSLIRIIQILKQKKEERPDFIFMDLFKDVYKRQFLHISMAWAMAPLAPLASYTLSVSYTHLFSNFLKGDIQLVPLNDIVEKELSSCVQSRFDLYKKDSSYYGIPTHVGASVVYYNMEILEKAGFTIEDVDAIETWDQYKEMGLQVFEKTGIPMTIYEVSNLSLIHISLA